MEPWFAEETFELLKERLILALMVREVRVRQKDSIPCQQSQELFPPSGLGITPTTLILFLCEVSSVFVWSLLFVDAQLLFRGLVL